MRILKQLKWFFREQRRQYLIGIVALLLIAFFNVIPARIIGNVVDAISNHRVTPAWLMIQVGIMLVAAACQYLLRFVWQKEIYGSSYVLERQLRGQLFHHFMKMDPSFYKRWRTGDLMAHATNDVEAVRQVASYGILAFADFIIAGGSMIIAMGTFVSWRLTILTLLPMPLLVVLSDRLGEKIHASYGEAQMAFGDLNNKIQESVTGIKVIQSLGEEKSDLKDFHRYVDKALRTNQRAYFWDALFNPVTTLIMGLSYVIAIAVGGWMVGQRYLTVGQLVTLITYLGELTWPLFAIGTLFNTLERGHASYDRIETVLSEKAAWQLPTKDEVHFGPIQFDIQSFSYPDSHQPVLRDIKFPLRPGEKVGIIGPTGSGKTSLLRLLVRDYDHYDGQITVSGDDIRTVPLEKYRSHLAYVPQVIFLFSTTIEKNLRFGDKDASPSAIEAVAAQAAMDQEINAMPDRYQTEVGQQGIILSGGQQQRLTLSRALLKKADLLVLDDPFSAIDAETASKIKDVLDHLDRRSLIMTASRLSTVQNMDWLIVMENGRITAQGRPDDLSRQPGWYRDTLKEQQHRQQLEDDLNE